MFLAKINKLQNHKILLFVFTSVWCMAEATASTMGSIMATVAVLEIHMDKKAVVAMNPSMIILGEVPIIWKNNFANRVSKHGRIIGISL
jgi:hypothetical protein